RADAPGIVDFIRGDLSGGASVTPVALELQLVRPHAHDPRYVARDLPGCVDRVRAPDVATEVGNAVVDPDIDVTEVVRGVGIQLRIDGVRQDLVGGTQFGSHRFGGSRHR